VVGGDDLIPRLSAYSTAELSHQLATLEWGSIVKNDWWKHMTSAMPEGPCSDLVKELEMYSRSATSKGTLPAWLQDSNKDLIRLVPAGKIVLLMRTTTDILPLMMEYHDAPMQLQVSNTCVSDHQASEYSGSLDRVNRSDLPGAEEGEGEVGFDEERLPKGERKGGSGRCCDSGTSGESCAQQ